MSFEEYLKETRRTWNYSLNERDRFDHALLGLVDESGELASAFKKELAYGRELDLTNVKEEIGDLMWFATRIIDELNFENTDRLFKIFDEGIDKDITESVNQQSTVTKISCVLSLATKTSSTHVLLSTQDGGMVIKHFMEIIFNVKFLCELMGFDLREVMEANINKLKTRFPEKFTNDNANNRNLDEERKSLEDGVSDN